MTHRRTAALLLAGAALLLTSCANTADAGDFAAPPGAALAALTPEMPSGEIVAQGTVLDDGSGAELCVGAVAESAPPQCSGIPLVGWSWEGLDDAVSSSGSTWGSYVVQGTYDGESLTVTGAPMSLALYDPMALPDPTDGEPGSATADDVRTIQEAVPDALGDAYLGSYDQDGWVFIDVVWDDGTWQEAADEDFGAGKVIVRSALRPVG